MALNDAPGEADATPGSGALGGRIAAVRGAIGFLTRLPVGGRESDWAAFRASLVAFPLAGYLLGALLALPFVLLPPIGTPAPVVAAAALAWCYLLVGINHVDGLADLGDAAAVHGGRERRLAVLKDTTVGVGALLAVGLVLAGLALAALAVADLALAGSTAVGSPGWPRAIRVAGVVVAAEVGAKLGMATVAALGTAATDGLGAQLTERARPASMVLPALVALPAAALTWPSPAAGAAFAAAVTVALVLRRWAHENLGGVNGDVMGAANELGRVAGLHAGVIAWTLS